MFPGLCWFFHILVWALGMSAHSKTSLMQGSMRRSITSWLAWLACSRLAKWLPWMRFWRIHTKRASMVRLKPVVPAQKTTMPPRFTMLHDTGKVCSPGCSNTKSTSLPLPVCSQMAAPNLRTFFMYSA